MKTRFKLLAITATILGLATSALLTKNEVTAEIILDAQPNQVWQILTDGENFSKWNPFVTNMQGVIQKGEKIVITMEPKPGKKMVFKPKVLEAVPNEELRWIGRVGVPGIFDGEHYFILEPYDGKTRLVHGEQFSGIALWFMDTNQFSKNFKAMNIALSQRVNEFNEAATQ